MSGTIDGGRKARDTNYAKYGKDFYRIQGAKGGKAGHTGGFFADRELARTAGALGGRISRRGKSKLGVRTVQLSDADKLDSYEHLESEPIVQTK